jgi:hypothetical protein
MIVGEIELNSATPLASMPLRVLRSDLARFRLRQASFCPASPCPPYSVIAKISIIVRGEPA